MTPVTATPTAGIPVGRPIAPAVAQNRTAHTPPTVTEPALVKLALCDPALESCFAAHLLYDPRGIDTDPTPRGVDIDRIEMIKTGFDHIRDMIGAISDSLDAEKPALDSVI